MNYKKTKCLSIEFMAEVPVENPERLINILKGQVFNNTRVNGCKIFKIDVIFTFRDKYERPLGAKENSQLASKGFYTPIVNAFGITSSVPVTHDIINQTLKHIMNMHTSFRMCIRRCSLDGALCFHKMKTETLDNIKAEIRLDTDWKIAADEKREGNDFDFENGPLWKCIFLPNATMNDDLTEDLLEYNCVVIFIQDHAINDGIGSVEMIKQFMSIINRLLDNKKIVTTLSPPILPTEYFLNKKHPITSFQKCCKLFLQTLLSFECMTPSLHWVLNTFVIKQDKVEEDSPTKTTRSHLQMFSKKETKTFVQACRNNGCTVQGAIQTATSVALLHTLRTQGKKLPIKMNTSVTIDMRRRLLDDSAEFLTGIHAAQFRMGLDISEEILQLDRSTTLLWKFARQSTNALHTQIKENKHLLNLLMYIPATYIERHFSLLMKLGRLSNPYLLFVSSLGRFNISESSTSLAKLNGFHLKFAGTKREELFTTFAATFDDQLSISHSYYPHLTNEYIKNEYFSTFDEIIQLLIEDGK